MDKVTHIFLLLVLVNIVRKGDCIRCYSCVSKGNDDCLDPEKYKMGKKICDLQALADTKAFAERIDPKFSKAFELDVVQTNHGDSIIPQQCLKQVTRIHNEDIILRGCQVSPTNNLDICKKIIGDVGKQPPINVTFCQLCDNDGCNSARKPETQLNALLISAIIALFAQCCLVYII